MAVWEQSIKQLPSLWVSKETILFKGVVIIYGWGGWPLHFPALKSLPPPLIEPPPTRKLWPLPIGDQECIMDESLFCVGNNMNKCIEQTTHKISDNTHLLYLNQGDKISKKGQNWGTIIFTGRGAVCLMVRPLREPWRFRICSITTSAMHRITTTNCILTYL